MARAPSEHKIERIYAIGDVHGCALELKLLLQQLSLSARTLVVFLGDYVDRGGESRQVIETIIELSRSVPVIALRGNHEEMFLDFLEHPESAGAGLFILNGGSATLASYEVETGRWDVPDEHRHFLKNLRTSFSTAEYFFVHAGVPDLPLAELSNDKHGDQMLWIRSTFLKSEYRWEKLVIHGHTPTNDVDIRENRVNVDTGCVFNNKLSALELPSMQVISVAKQKFGEEPVYLRDARMAGRVATRFAGSLQVEIQKNGKTLIFETLNYNHMGLLIREPYTESFHGIGGGPLLAINETILGRIGRADKIEVHFTGTIVRMETRGDANLYGVKILNMTAPDETL